MSIDRFDTRAGPKAVARWNTSLTLGNRILLITLWPCPVELIGCPTNQIKRAHNSTWINLKWILNVLGHPPKQKEFMDSRGAVGSDSQRGLLDALFADRDIGEDNRLPQNAALSMIRLGDEDVREEVVIRPGFRYAILKITNHTMTAHTGVWSWTPQEVQ